jgi:hypothetical protein
LVPLSFYDREPLLGLMLAALAADILAVFILNHRSLSFRHLANQ